MESQDLLLGIESDEDHMFDEAEESSEKSDGSSEISQTEARRSSFLSTSPQWPQSYRKSVGYSIAASPNFSLISPSFSLISGSSWKNIPTSAEIPEYASEELKAHLLAPKWDLAAPVHGLPHIPSKEDLKQLKLEGFEDKEPVTEGCNFVQTVLNGVNVMAGVGLLSTPYALKEGGWIGFALLFMFAVICCYTGILLRWCMDSHPGLLAYPDIGQVAFGKIGRILISIVLYIELYGTCVEFLILEGDNLSRLFPCAYLSWDWIHMDSHKCFAVLTALLVLPTVYLRDLSLLSYLSVGGIVTITFVAVSVFWVGAIDGVGFDNTVPLANWVGIPLSVGVYGYCFSGHSVFPNIYSSMKNRNQYNRMLLVSFSICTLLYGGVAIMGYLMFGEETVSQITLNLPWHFIASKISVWMTVINPFTKFSLILTPVAMGLEELLPPRYFGNQWASMIIVRTALVASTAIFATSVPLFGYLMSLIGSVFSMLAAVVLPCACFLSIYWEQTGVLQITTCVTIIAIGVIGGVFGTYSSLISIINSL